MKKSFLTQHGFASTKLTAVALLILGGFGAWWVLRNDGGSRVNNSANSNNATQTQTVSAKDIEAVKTAAEPKCENASVRYIEGPERKESGFVKDEVLFSPDGMFARVGAFCAYAEGGGGGLDVTLKKIDGNWVVIKQSQEQPNKEWGEQYGAPEGWFTTQY